MYLTDENEILRLVSLYTRYVDAADYEALENIFTPDASLIIGDGSPAKGITEIIPQMQASAIKRLAGAPGNFQRHMVDRAPVEFEGDNHANAVFCFLVVCENGPDHSGRYVDNYFRTEAGWRIFQRTISVEWISEDSRLHMVLGNRSI